jgi:hypothetical protein
VARGTRGTLPRHRMYGKLSKCRFWLRQVAFFGHIISKGGISVDPSKIQDALCWNTPMNVGNIFGVFLDRLGIIRDLSKGSQR